MTGNITSPTLAGMCVTIAFVQDRTGGLKPVAVLNPSVLRKLLQRAERRNYGP